MGHLEVRLSEQDVQRIARAVVAEIRGEAGKAPRAAYKPSGTAEDVREHVADRVLRMLQSGPKRRRPMHQSLSGNRRQYLDAVLSDLVAAGLVRYSDDGLESPYGLYTLVR